MNRVHLIKTNRHRVVGAAAGTAAVSLAPMGCTPASGGPTSAGAKTADKSQIDQFLLAPADAKNFQAKQAITPVKGQIQVNAWNC